MDKFTITKMSESLLQNKSIKYEEIIKADVKRICDVHLHKSWAMTRSITKQKQILKTLFIAKPGLEYCFYQCETWMRRIEGHGIKSVCVSVHLHVHGSSSVRFRDKFVNIAASESETRPKNVQNALEFFKNCVFSLQLCCCYPVEVCES